ncbi:endonuclease III domain-containing protein [Acetanaerobacterium elongatum]|uniref:DNA-3-methyladenine glycosylase III n=1 Tax=Acetanaerobacterium elongatum TaxID=258515 RepID=A0A1G9UNK9_9FIRM|nr:endonuclease III domain-containing protein [Acetanaerobacterium elongatum]SDM61518.1 DNA-3-methyladenine glycosylase III [Acetanaerobacterium elongatum]
MAAHYEGLTELFDKLLAAYGKRHWWPAQTPFEMMVGAILTQNTAWSNVERALAGFGENLTPQYILTCDEANLAEIIRPSGYYNQKAVRLKTLARWYEGYGFDINRVRAKSGEALREELLALNGVGHETAYSMLLYAFDKPYFVVDAYTRRLFERLGLTVPKDYDEFRLAIEASIPQDLYLYNEFHALIVAHAKEHCKVKPCCDGCPITSRCTYEISGQILKNVL